MGNRIAYLEGMRGICAIAVFNCHIIPWLLPGVTQTHLYKLFLKTPVFKMQSGAFGVSYFFFYLDTLLCLDQKKHGGEMEKR